MRTVVNLSDSREQIEAFAAQEGFDSAEYMALYDAGQVIALQMGVDFTTDDFKARLGRGLQFMATQEGPYLEHCREGKDREGFVCALLICFLRANYEAAIDDYMTSFENYFHLTEGSEQYEAVKNSNIVPMLETIAGVEAGADLRAIDLAAAAREYILSTGLSTEEVDALYANLAKDYSAEF